MSKERDRKSELVLRSTYQILNGIETTRIEIFITLSDMFTYNKYKKVRHSIRSLQFDQKVRPLSFRPEKFDLFTATPAGLGVSSASLLELLAFLASAFGASDFPTTIFSETFEDVSFTKVLEEWLSLPNEQESPLDGTHKKWTQPVFVKTAQDLFSRMDDKHRKVLNVHQGMFRSQWLNVVPCEKLGLKLNYQQLRISIGWLLGANICVAHTCHSGES